MVCGIYDSAQSTVSVWLNMGVVGRKYTSKGEAYMFNNLCAEESCLQRFRKKSPERTPNYYLLSSHTKFASTSKNSHKKKVSCSEEVSTTAHEFYECTLH